MVFNFAMSTFKYYTYVDQYYVRQRKIDFFEVKLKMIDRSFEREDIALELSSHFNKFFNMGDAILQFDVSFVDEIPMPATGKILSVTSDLQMGHGK
jgi:hypothetical protein